MPRFGSIGTQYFDNAGDPLVSGKLYFYETGTNTLKDTFADINLSIPNSNPVILTASGRQPNIFFNGSARVVLAQSNDVQVEVRDPVGSSVEEGVFSPWNPLTIYNLNDIVEYGGLFYISITNGNQDHDPSATPTTWTQFKLLKVWNQNETYAENDVVQASNGQMYYSTIAGNLSNDPVTDTVNWSPVVYVPPVPLSAAAKMYSY